MMLVSDVAPSDEVIDAAKRTRTVIGSSEVCFVLCVLSTTEQSFYVDTRPSVLNE